LLIGADYECFVGGGWAVSADYVRVDFQKKARFQARKRAFFIFFQKNMDFKSTLL
jgi:hypothetical protein